MNRENIACISGMRISLLVESTTAEIRPQFCPGVLQWSDVYYCHGERVSLSHVDLAGAEVESAERQLWCAVLGRAVHDATNHIATVSGPVERQRIRQAARDWFTQNGQEYRLACEAAGYDPDYLRTRVLSLMAHAD